MTHATATDRYLARMRAVLAHIDAHLDRALDVAWRAEVAAFSKSHFHRQFALLFGMNAGRHVQLLRLKGAACQRPGTPRHPTRWPAFAPPIGAEMADMGAPRGYVTA
ncbi:hypothetical protein [Ralstonia condita]|uniref:hypothetical protein n=1 Tax=Ralstonia condita TaxID=3058600 RepID=UPI003D17F6EB